MYKKILVICLFLFLIITLVSSPVAAAYSSVPEITATVDIPGFRENVKGLEYTGPLDRASINSLGYYTISGWSDRLYYRDDLTTYFPNNSGFISHYVLYGRFVNDVYSPGIEQSISYTSAQVRYVSSRLPGYLGSIVLNDLGVLRGKFLTGNSDLIYFGNAAQHFIPYSSGTLSGDVGIYSYSNGGGTYGYQMFLQNDIVLGRYDTSFNVYTYRDVSTNKVKVSLDAFSGCVPINIYVYDSVGTLFKKYFTTGSGSFELDLGFSDTYTLNIGVQGEGLAKRIVIGDTTEEMNIDSVGISPQEIPEGEVGTFTITAYDQAHNELPGELFTLIGNTNDAVLTAYNNFNGKSIHYVANIPGETTLTLQSQSHPSFTVQHAIFVTAAATPTPTSTSIFPTITPTTTSTPLPTSTTVIPDVTPTAPPGSEYPVPDIQVTRLGHNDRLEISLNGYLSSVTSWDSNNVILFYDNTSSDLTRIVPNGNDYSVLIYQNDIGYTWNFTRATSSVEPTPTTAFPYVTPTAPPGSEYPVPDIQVNRVGYDDIVDVRLNGYLSTVTAYDTDGLILILEQTAANFTRTIPNYNDYSIYIHQNNIGYTWNFTGTMASSDLLFSEYFYQTVSAAVPYDGHRLTCKLESVSLSPLVPAQKKYNLELTTGGYTSNVLISKLTGPSRPWADITSTTATGTWTQRLNVQNGAYYRAVVTTGPAQNVFWWNESGLLTDDPVLVLNPGVPTITPTIIPVPTSSWTPYPTPTPFPTFSNNSTAWDLSVPIHLNALDINFDNFKLSPHISGTDSVLTRPELVAMLTNSDFAGIYIVSWWFGVVDLFVDGIIFVFSVLLGIVAIPFIYLYDLMVVAHSWIMSVSLTIQAYLFVPNRILSAAFALIPVPVQGVILLGMIVDAVFLFARLILGIKDRSYSEDES